MKPYLKRTLEDDILPVIDSPKAIFILGARQVGKTSLLKRLIDFVGKDNSLLFDLEHPQLLHSFTQGIEEIVSLFELNRPKQYGKLYVLIDEIQYLDDFSHTIKYLVDHYADKYKLIMSGSSSLLIKKKFSESLVGRKLVFELFPLSLTEFCLFKGETRIAELISQPYDQTKPDPLRVACAKMQELISEYIIYGGYPEVALTDSIPAKKRILADVVSSYIIKDIKHLFRIEKMEQFNHLVLFLSYNIGKELNLSSVAKETALHRETVKAHLNALSSAYVINVLRPFFSNKPKELKKMPKVYFIDTGIRNSLINDFSDLHSRYDKGELFENYVLNQIRSRCKDLSEIKFWKTNDGKEIDFIVIAENEILAFEAKFGKAFNNHFAAFKNSYPKAVCNTIRFSKEKQDDDLPAFF